MAASATPNMRLADLAARVGAKLEGDGDVLVSRIGTLERAGPGAIAFLANPKYRSLLDATQASAVIVAPEIAPATRLPKLVSRNPYVTFAKVATLLNPARERASGTDPSAVVDPSAQIAATAAVGPLAVVGAGVTVGERSRVGAHCVLGEGVAIGDDVLLHPQVTIYADCSIGPRTIIHSGAVIGADGFGLAEDAGRWLKIPQVGRVVIGADVEIGANTTIDRGAIEDTVIEDDVKLDNQIQIAHNCVIGAHTAIAGCAAIAGSTRVGRNCKIGGAAMLNGHITIADDVTIAAATPVMASIADAGVYTGIFPSSPHREWKRIALALRHLHQMSQRVAALEQALAADREPR